MHAIINLFTTRGFTLQGIPTHIHHLANHRAKNSVIKRIKANRRLEPRLNIGNIRWAHLSFNNQVVTNRDNLHQLLARTQHAAHCSDPHILDNTRQQSGKHTVLQLLLTLSENLNILRNTIIGVVQFNPRLFQILVASVN